MSTTATKQKKTFKESAKETGQKVKSFAKKQTDKVKSSAKRYGSDIRTAYDTGYARGWDDAYKIPKRFGAKIVAAFGYKKGIRDHRRSDKYIHQYNRGGKQQ